MIIQEISSEKWELLVREEKLVSFFELPNWYKLWEDYFNTTTKSYLIDGHLLFSAIRLTGAKGLIQFYNSSPAGTYSNIRSVRGEYELTNTDLHNLQKKLGLSFLRLSPFSTVRFSPNCHAIESDQTQIIELDRIQTISANWSRNHKRLLQKAQSQGIEISVSDAPEDWKDYYELYEKFLLTKKENARTHFEFKLFESIRFLPSKFRKLWLAKIENRIMGGRLVFYTNDYAVEWHACTGEEHKDIGVNQLLLYRILENAKKEKYPIYDFNPSAHLTGVVEFKRKFGAISKPSPVFKSYSLAQKLYLRTIVR